MCNADCCCRNLTTNGLINTLLIFTSINLVISFAAIFIRASNTERYDKALMYLELINNGTFTNVQFDDCKKSGYIFKDGYYCKINGEYLKKPSDSVSNQGLFKNWKKAEIAINTIRTLITLIFMILFCVWIKPKSNSIQSMDKDERIKYSKNLNHFSICTSFMILLSALCILIRALGLTPNMQIGLYPDTDQNSFESNIAINYIIDIIEIVLYSIAICFIYRLKRTVEIRPIPRQQQQPPSTSTNFNPVAINVRPQPQVPIYQPNPIVSEQIIIRQRIVQQSISTGRRDHILDNF